MEPAPDGPTPAPKPGRIALPLRIWGPIAVLAGLLIAAMAQPLAYALECYRLNASGERARAEVLSAVPEGGLGLRILDGPHAGRTCGARTHPDHAARLAAGDALDVVIPDADPERCVLAATLENSAHLLWLIGSLIVAVLLLLVLAGLFLQRSFRSPSGPTTRLDVPGGVVPCPRCQNPMREGYLPLLAGLHWREPGEPVGLPHVFSGLPGTVGWRGRPRLHAWRCVPCAVVTLHHGPPGAAPLQK